MAMNTRPVIDMDKSVNDNARVLAQAAESYLEKHPKSTLSDVMSILIFSILEMDEVHDELEAKILLSMGRSFGCQIINTPEDEINLSSQEDKQLDEALDGMDLDDGDATPSVTHGIDLATQDDDDGDLGS